MHGCTLVEETVIAIPRKGAIYAITQHEFCFFAVLSVGEEQSVNELNHLIAAIAAEVHTEPVERIIESASLASQYSNCLLTFYFADSMIHSFLLIYPNLHLVSRQNQSFCVEQSWSHLALVALS